MNNLLLMNLQDSQNQFSCILKASIIINLKLLLVVKYKPNSSQSLHTYPPETDKIALQFCESD